jgi:hypothetical protein
MSRADEPQICPQCRSEFLDRKLGRITRKEQGIALLAYMLVGVMGAAFVVGISEYIDARILLLFPLNIVFGVVFWWRNLRKTRPQTISCHSCGFSAPATQRPASK